MSEWDEIAERGRELDFADAANEIVKDLLDESGALILARRMYLPWHPVKARRCHRAVRKIHRRVRLINARIGDVLDMHRSASGYMRLDDLL
jgi:hypothetical protein